MHVTKETTAWRTRCRGRGRKKRERPQNKGPEFLPGLFNQTGSTRLELATSCVTGRRSNQLNYDPVDKLKSYTSLKDKKIGAFLATPRLVSVAAVYDRRN